VRDGIAVCIKLESLFVPGVAKFMRAESAHSVGWGKLAGNVC